MTVRKQHYVPRFYLKHFTNVEGKLQIVRRTNGAHFVATPEYVCAENYLYEAKKLPRDSNNEDLKYLFNYIERGLAAIESKLSPLFEQLVRCCERRDFKTDSFDEARFATCILVATLIARHPRILEQERIRAIEVDGLIDANNVLTEQDLSELNRRGLTKYREPICEIAIMWALLLSGDPRTPLARIANSLAQKQMTILEAPPGGSFVTASMPVNLITSEFDPHNFQEAYFPLTNRYAVRFTKNEGEVVFKELNDEALNKCNAHMLANDLWETAISSSEDALMVAVSRSQAK